MRIIDLAQPAPVVVPTTIPVTDAAMRMRRFHVGDLLVTRTEGAHQIPVGILTDRDIAIGIVGPAGEELPGLTVGDVLSNAEVITIDEEAPLEDAIELLHAHGIRRLPVVDGNGSLTGIITLDDLLQHLTSQLEKLASVVSRQRSRETRARP